MRLSYQPSKESMTKGYMKIVPKDANVEFYVKDGYVTGTYYAMAFIGKSGKPAWNYQFRSLERREAKIKEQIEASKASMVFKAEQRAERNKPHSLKVGDVLSSSWGYDQTNVDFYMITRVVGPHMVEAGRIGKKPGKRGDNYVTADLSSKPASTKRHKANSSNSIHVDRGGSASLDRPGDEHYETPFGYGH